MMNPKHNSPRQRSRKAHAPYNFVPLPEKVVQARDPLDQDVYHDQGLTGWIECELKTCAPTYVRGMFTEDEYKKQGNKKPEELTPDEKERRAPFFAMTEDRVEGRFKPVIPGSSLRGMTRMLVEIAGYGRVRWVADEPTFTFRAVAAARDEPLRDPYQKALGHFGRKVQAGYLEREGDHWYVQPALTPAAMGWPEKNAYLKVKERQIKAKDLPGYFSLNNWNYRPQWHQVSFDVESRGGKRGWFVYVSRIGSNEIGYKHQGVLVCSGNMLETGQEGQKSPRSNHVLILRADEKGKRLKIRPQSVQDYLAGLTPFQKEALTHWGGGQWACLKHGAPVFYVAEGDEVVYFGHSPNFRIPAQLAGEERAATPLDFVPSGLRDDPRPDLADVIFGWVEESERGPKGHRAGRVFFSDAYFVEAREGVWLKSEPITPHTLSGPKPTTFQHYLVQDRDAGHDPDDKKSLAHYGTPPNETQIRGHKLYWHKGENPDIEATAKERQHEKQLTRIVPLQPGVRFSFKIYFENLRDEELGALWWAVALPGEKGKTYRHKLGMGKPLGMGAVAITPRLYLTDRPARYAHLFSDGSWEEAAREGDAEPYLEAFESFVLKESQVAPDADRLAEVERIQQLLALLQWHEDDNTWLEATRYMEIEHGPDKINEYKERPVLPDPLAVVAEQPVQSPVRQRDKKPTRHTKPEPKPGAGATSETRTGRVKWFDDQKGYGFIQVDDSQEELFVHYTDIAGEGFRTLNENDRVEFSIGEGDKGPKAINVRVI
jgi:CRISPR-associated protein (TIGR03986 family)